MYEDNSRNSPAHPGAPDRYRLRKYNVDWDSFHWNVSHEVDNSNGSQSKMEL